MTRGLTFSVVLHLALIVLAIFGLPELVRDRPLEDRLVVVEVVTVGAVTNAPPPSQQVKKPDTPTQKPTAKPDAPKSPPPPPTAAATPPPPSPKIDPPKVEAPKVAVPKTEPPKPQTERSMAAATEAPKAEPVPVPAPKAPATEPAPKPQPAAKAEPVPLPKPKPQEAKPPVPDAEAIPLPKPKPQEVKKPDPEPEAPKPAEVAKPEPPKTEPPKPEPPKAEPAKPQAESVKAAEVTPAPPVPVSRPTPPKRPEQQVAKATQPTPEKEKKPEQTDDFMNVLKTVQKMKQAAAQPNETTQNAPKTTDSTVRQSNFDADRPLSVSEMDAIRQQIARCWLVPAGAKEGASLLVEIHVRMNVDRTVRDAQIVDASRMSDPFFRAAAESALRALRNPSCTPLNLPPEKYETWKSFTITFDPRDMLS